MLDFYNLACPLVSLVCAGDRTDAHGCGDLLAVRSAQPAEELEPTEQHRPPCNDEPAAAELLGEDVRAHGHHDAQEKPQPAMQEIPRAVRRLLGGRTVRRRVRSVDG